MGCSCFVSILNQFPLMLKDSAPRTSSRKAPRDFPVSHDLPLQELPICLVGISLNYFAVSRWASGLGDKTHRRKTWQGQQPSGPVPSAKAVRARAGPVVFPSLGFLAGKWECPDPPSWGHGCDGRHPHRARAAADGGSHDDCDIGSRARPTLPSWLWVPGPEGLSFLWSCSWPPPPLLDAVTHFTGGDIPRLPRSSHLWPPRRPPSNGLRDEQPPRSTCLPACTSCPTVLLAPSSHLALLTLPSLALHLPQPLQTQGQRVQVPP